MKNKCLRYFLLAVLMLPFAVSTWAQSVQDFTYSHLGQSDGMLSQRVYSIKLLDIRIK